MKKKNQRINFKFLSVKSFADIREYLRRKVKRLKSEKSLSIYTQDDEMWKYCKIGLIHWLHVCMVLPDINCSGYFRFKLL